MLQVGDFDTMFKSLWRGGAIASFPGFFLGAIVQAVLRPGSIQQNGGMFGFLGFMALVISAIGYYFPELANAH